MCPGPDYVCHSMVWVKRRYREGIPNHDRHYNNVQADRKEQLGFHSRSFHCQTESISFDAPDAHGQGVSFRPRRIFG